eukprot:TRINITY_DN17768_c0_g1_i1.p1 TRINITY_DN17768_c0_g1~~TRINITY_DN17768_c0_g1_i1.p1  ORF type:complete len:1046 (+),score=334.04 TRINITY_DN17768_c0_g1_i1:92-3139(+)
MRGGAAALALCAAAASGAEPLTALLERLRFRNSGTVRRGDVYRLIALPSIYNEGYTYMGAGHSDWTNLPGSIPWSGVEYLFRVEGRGSSSYTCNGSAMIGSDLISLTGLADAEACAAACEANARNSTGPQRCRAWTYDGTQHPSGCALKWGIGEIEPKPGLVTGCSRAFPLSGCDCSAQSSALLRVPPSGMRSAVPLGGLGEGSVELRADGRLADWGTILNNGPYAADKGWARKIDVDDAAFGVLAVGAKAKAAKLLRTHPGHDGLPAVDALRYSGAFPAAELAAQDADLAAAGVSVTLRAFSEFEMHSAANSVAPGAFFSLTLEAQQGAAAERAAVFFNLPDMIGGSQYRTHSLGAQSGITMHNAGTQQPLAEGNFSWTYLHCDGCSAAPHVSAAVGASLQENWAAFVSGGGTLPGLANGTAHHGALAAALPLAAGQKVTLTFALTWFFPQRRWGETTLGHWYENNYTSSEDVAAQRGTESRLAATVESALAWQATCFNNSFSAALQDSLVNTPATWGKVSFWTRDGRWRNFESHACAQMEPPHIHFYRALGYNLFLPELEHQTARMYAAAQDADGLVEELFGCGCGGCAGGADDLDKAKGGARGDDNPVFVLDVYMNWKKGTGGSGWLGSMWPATAKALRWMLQTAPAPYHLPYKLVNTHDEHGMIGDVNAYNAFAFLAGLAAGRQMAAAVGDNATEALARQGLADGREQLQGLLWNATQQHWAQAWCENIPSTANGAALQSGDLYGMVWAELLGLSGEVGVPSERIRSHLRNERARNINADGLLVFATNRTVDYYQGCPGSEAASAAGTGQTGVSKMRTGFIDQDVWSSHAPVHAAMSIFAGYGDTADALAIAAKEMDLYRETMADQWDYRDTTTTYAPDGSFSAQGIKRPTVNSHYARQTIWWAIPLALTGQQYDAPRRELQLRLNAALLGPQQEGSSAQFPLLLPRGSAVARYEPGTGSRGACLSATVTAGVVDLAAHAVSLQLPGESQPRRLRAQGTAARAGESLRLCE